MAKIKQTRRIVKYIDDFGSITTLEAMRDIGVTNLHARLYDLKKEGYVITGTPEQSKNRYGDKVHYKRYRINKNENINKYVK